MIIKFNKNLLFFNIKLWTNGFFCKFFLIKGGNEQKNYKGPINIWGFNILKILFSKFKYSYLLKIFL